MASQPNSAFESLEHQLVSLISERLLETRPDFNADSNLYDNGLDSMAIMQLLVLVEEKYRVAIPEGDLTRQNFSTTRHLAELIRESSARAA
ncbi:MAG: Phosphopantetheine-binding protein [Chthoniobacteraceae bacterium]|nr:Phosphopantetheine-binding protein [Chthoniobacteraceae bacterium]MDB6172257.1 Phosphopantetheine-binding protein [Chthoniobacteraceae bacterium]